MNNLSFFFFIIGAIFITIGIMENKYKKIENKTIEYRIIPRNLYEEQMAPTNLKNTLGALFEDNTETSKTYNLI
jgi:hypothetical protein